MKNLDELNLSDLQFVFTDIDDTLTLNGKLPPESYEALWRLKNRGFRIAPITGRPAGWCELIARLWPVDGVIGENGGLYYRLVDNNMRRHYAVDPSTLKDNHKRLEKIQTEVLAQIPGTKLASDQFCRKMDLAIDFAEDVTPPLRRDQVEQIVKVFHKHGATAKVSSIHVNGWFGDYDKLSMCRLFLEKEFSLNMDSILDQLIFVGDSPNDEPMFKAFTHSVAVANIQTFLPELQYLPKYITPSEGGLGFKELADRLCR